MANYTSSAKVVLSINGRQAQQVLHNLQNDAKRLERQLAQAATAGDKASMKKLQRELKSTQRMIEQVKGSSTATENVLRRLDKASPRDLQRTLKTLQQQLNGIERGSAAWNNHINKIKMVKAEITKLNMSMANQKSLWDRFNIWMNNCQATIFAFAAAISGLVMAARSAVKSFAEMEESMANTRKYTRMTATDVEILNEKFKKMDTRLAREELNLLAQEAGRLGKNNLDDVMQYVEASQIIKVALVDLGEGATQTIAKLTNIFGVEQAMGTKDAMLAVGSAVNHLSQNCTASKQYLVEFAQRMAGIGASAGMTIPEILAFGAVLDANGQKVEMSATAMQRVLMKLANKNREFADALGMDAEKLNVAFANSAQEGLLMFLERIHEMQEQTDYDNTIMVLAPIFKDLGLDAARVSQVLATLAQHIDEVKWQLGEAEQAFNQATSATNEFNIFNNTAQAKLDKAKNKVHELAVELGQKLYPVMAHIYKSSSLMLRVLNVLVTFIIQHRFAIGLLVVAVASYYTAIGIARLRVIALDAATLIYNRTINLLKYSVGLAKVAVTLFTGGLGAANTAFKALNATMKANPFGLVVALLATLYYAIKNVEDETDEYTKTLDEAVTSAKGFSAEAIKEQHELDVLFGKLEAAEKGSADYKAIKDKIIQQYGKYLNGLIDEKGEIIDLTRAYNRLAEAVRRAARERGLAEAEGKINDAYYAEMNNNLQDLQTSLEQRGASPKQAASIVQSVGQAMAAGKPIPQATINQINAYSRVTPSMGFWDGANYTLRNTDPNAWGGVPAWVNNKIASVLPGNADKYIRDPAGIVNNMYSVTERKDNALGNIEAMRDGVNPMRHVSDTDIELAVKFFDKIIQSGKSGSAPIFQEGNVWEYTVLTPEQAKRYKEQYTDELAIRGGGNSGKAGAGGNHEPYYPEDYGADGKNDKKNNSSSSAKAEDKFAAEKDWRERAEAQARIDYATGLKDYIEFTKEMDEIAVQFYTLQLQHTDLTETEKLTIQAQYYEAQKKLSEDLTDFTLEEEDERYRQELAQYKDYYIRGVINQKTYDSKIEELEMKHYANILKITKKGTKKYIEAENRLLEMGVEQKKRKLKEYQDYYEKYLKMGEEMWSTPEVLAQNEINEMTKSFNIYYTEAVKSDNFDEAKRLWEKYFEEVEKIKQKYNLNSDNSNPIKNMVDKSIEWLNGPGGKAMTGAVDTLVSGMSAIFTQLSSLIQAELDMQTAAIEKRYDSEVEKAEGNSYRVALLEKKKEAEIAKAKKDANRKMFAMQVIQAVAQTAQGAISAYSSAAAVPVIGWVLAPIAAGMALAAGAIQIAAIKKQQQASEAQGYSEGGFTPEGDKDEPVGVVHAGEWVASQKLTRNPRIRPMLEALDQAQRNNTIGSLTHEAVSYLMPATAGTTQGAIRQQQSSVIVNAPDSANSVALVRTLDSLNSRLSTLDSRLNEPFVTVNTVSGDLGIKKAQDEYQRYIRNKSPKKF